MPKPNGRPPGHILHAEGFEAFLQLSGSTKSQVAKAAGIAPSFLSDLLAHRAGASDVTAANLAEALGPVPPTAIFPEIAGWVSPLPNREQCRTRPDEQAAA